MSKRVRLSLAEVLQQKNVTRYRLSKEAKVDYPIIDKYYKNKVSRYDRDTLLRICLALDCEPGDIIRLVETDDGKGEGA